MNSNSNSCVNLFECGHIVNQLSKSYLLIRYPWMTVFLLVSFLPVPLTSSHGLDIYLWNKLQFSQNGKGHGIQMLVINALSLYSSQTQGWHHKKGQNTCPRGGERQQSMRETVWFSNSFYVLTRKKELNSICQTVLLLSGAPWLNFGRWNMDRTWFLKYPP